MIIQYIIAGIACVIFLVRATIFFRVITGRSRIRVLTKDAQGRDVETEVTIKV